MAIQITKEVVGKSRYNKMNDMRHDALYTHQQTSDIAERSPTLYNWQYIIPLIDVSITEYYLQLDASKRYEKSISIDSRE